MPENEAAFLLRVLNQETPLGRVLDGNAKAKFQGMIWNRLLALGFIAECNEGQQKWYLHINDNTGMWEN